MPQRFASGCHSSGARCGSVPRSSSSAHASTPASSEQKTQTQYNRGEIGLKHLISEKPAVIAM